MDVLVLSLSINGLKYDCNNNNIYEYISNNINQIEYDNKYDYNEDFILIFIINDKNNYILYGYNELYSKIIFNPIGIIDSISLLNNIKDKCCWKKIKISFNKLSQICQQIIIPIPNATWNKQLSDNIPEIKEFSVSLQEGVKHIKLGYRLWRHTKKEKNHGRTAALDPFRGANGGASMGVPLGGLGSGSIGRGWKGDFSRWLLRPGYPSYKTIPGNQFSLRYCKKTSSKIICSVLNEYTGKNSSKLKNNWNWLTSNQLSKCYYHGLFPKAWTVYNCFQPDLRIQCTQLSPVIAHNYKESCYPVSIFYWEIENISDEDINVSLMLTWANLMGLKHKRATNIGHNNKLYTKTKDNIEISGIQMHHYQTIICEYNKKKHKHSSTYHDPIAFSIAGLNKDLTYKTSIKFSSDKESKELWNEFKENGYLNNSNFSYTSKFNEKLGCALCYNKIIPAGKTKTFEFTVAWHIPIIRFGSSKAYYRRYTKFYGYEEDCIQDIAIDALLNWKKWNIDINLWQLPILQNNKLSNTYKHGLFNELYYLVAGGSEWIDKALNDNICDNNLLNTNIDEQENDDDDDDSCSEDYLMINEYNEYGKFLYLESLDYLMYNTYDVHWYASFALAMCWPFIEITIQKDFAKATMIDHNEEWKILSSGSYGIKKVRGCVPHDLGHPGGNPWIRVNAYNIQDINRWKDLNCKFILQTYRDYILVNDNNFLEEIYPVLNSCFNYLLFFTNTIDNISTKEELLDYKKKKIQSPFENCMIENEGFPDQTYDAWSVSGCSAYCGGLWVASLQVLKKIAKILNDNNKYIYYKNIYKHAKIYYNKTLWNGKYFNYDNSNTIVSDSIMSDQLAGNWYLKICDFKNTITSDDRAISSMNTIYDYNLLKYKKGLYGIVNGMKVNGKVDKSCLQSLEVWAGTCYTVASQMWLLGMHKEALQVAESVINATYNLGYGFQTPEAWEKKGNYRALGYMRPLSIWSLQWAIENTQNE